MLYIDIYDCLLASLRDIDQLHCLRLRSHDLACHLFFFFKTHHFIAPRNKMRNLKKRSE